jgi:hypothetical protein
VWVILRVTVQASEGAHVVLRHGPAAELDQSNPLSSDLALFDMYLTALDAALSRPEVLMALDEFGLSSAKLRSELVAGAGPGTRQSRSCGLKQL